jgi:hypothetical protein
VLRKKEKVVTKIKGLDSLRSGFKNGLEAALNED